MLQHKEECGSSGGMGFLSLQNEFTTVFIYGFLEGFCAEREMSFMLTFLQMLSNTRFGRSRRNKKFLEEQKWWLKKKMSKFL